MAKSKLEVLETLKDTCYDFFEELLELEKYLESIEYDYYSGLEDPQVTNIKASTFKNMEVVYYVYGRAMGGLASITMALMHAVVGKDVSMIGKSAEGCWLLLASLDNARFDVEHTTKMFGSDEYNDNLLDNLYHIEDASQALYNLCDSLVSSDYKRRVRHQKEAARETILRAASAGEKMLRTANKSKDNILRYITMW